ncbi:hypothetical protein KEM56_004467 [Ascosphaera pollenicola]|nr:hypothetical protein KEM56_004467 [Ascosphaera pollenicola]
MKRDLRPIEELASWSSLAQISLNDVKVAKLEANGVDKGSAVVATKDIPVSDGSTVLMKVDRDMVLSLERVKDYAKSDRHLKEILEALGDYAQTPRGAILTFLMVNHTYASPSTAQEDKIPTTWTDYLRFLPASFTLPTTYRFEERELIQGTSLELALFTKLETIEWEFSKLMSSTANIEWCDRLWWGSTGHAMLDDWVLVDAIFRSRALDLPGTGHSMVPCVDMANHASGDETVALYESDEDGNALLLLREGKSVKDGEEITITYGDDKGASELIFSYGFLPSDIDDARALYLDLQVAPDDPLALPKKSCSKVPPGLRLARDEKTGKTCWESQFVWWICVNQEDGLDFKVIKVSEEEKEVKVFFKETEVEPTEILEELLRKDEKWPVYELRAVVTIQNRIQEQFDALMTAEQKKETWEEMVKDGEIRKDVYDTLLRLRDLEGKLMKDALNELEEKKLQLAENETVKSTMKTIHHKTKIQLPNDHTMQQHSMIQFARPTSMSAHFGPGRLVDIMALVNGNIAGRSVSDE